MINQAVVVLRHDTNFTEMCIDSNHGIPTGVPIVVEFGLEIAEDGWFKYNARFIRFSYCEQIIPLQ